jgi:hypothetical protein
VEPPTARRHPMNARRYLCLLLPLLTWAVCFAQEIQPAPRDCPPADGYEWTKFNDAPSGKVVWVQARTEQQFVDACKNTQASACALRFQNLTVVVARAPEYVYSEAFKQHEGCHDSHNHGAAPTLSLYR